MFSRASIWISKTLGSQSQNEDIGEPSSSSSSAAAVVKKRRVDNNITNRPNPLTPPTTPTMSNYKHYTIPTPNQVIGEENDNKYNKSNSVSTLVISKNNENSPSPIKKRRLDTTILHDKKKATVYHCPYKWCKKTIYNQEKAFFNHIRKDHYSGFPPLIPPKDYIFQNINGDIIGFSERFHNTISDGQEIFSKDLKIRYYCPYKNCIETNYCRQHLFSHIRSIHYKDFPEFKEFNRLVYKNTLTNQTIRFDEKSRNCLNDNESITIIKVSKNNDLDLYYCPFQDCEYGQGLLYFSDLYKHIRREHQCMETLPQRQRLAKTSKQFHLTIKSGQVLDLSDSNCRNTLNNNDIIHIQYY